MVPSAITKGLRVIALPLTRPSNARPQLIYYLVQSPPKPPSKNPHWIKKSFDKAATTWAAFGEAPKDNWKYKLFAWGERVADRVEFEETALKAVDTSITIPPANDKVQAAEEKVVAPFIYPASIANPYTLWQRHVEEREPLHKRYMNLWLLGLPITAPLGIAPIIPNIPFYFCAWRAWSHWKAWSGTKYLNKLIAAKHFQPVQSQELDQIYEAASVEAIESNTDSKSNVDKEQTQTSTASESTPLISKDPELEAELLLKPSAVPKILSTFELPPAVGAEILRAMEQARLRLSKSKNGT